MRRALCAFALIWLPACAGPTPVIYPSGSVVSVNTSQVYRQNAPARTGTVVAPQGPFQPNAYLFVCNNISISNRPAATGAGKILSYSPIVNVNGVALAAAPANDVCLTSGFGPRYGRMHKGLDLQSRPAGPIYAAGPGRILEAGSARGFGNQVVIDHGRGVYTRYAHLARFAPALRAGQLIGFGQPVGQMGQSGNATAVHLHYEVLTGNYNTPRKSFGLSAHNPLDFPAWQGLANEIG